MKKRMSYFAIASLAGFFHAIILPVGLLKEVEELSVYYKKEVVDDKTFVYREDVVNGVKKEVWTIDGVPVAFDEYEEAVLEAEKEVRRRERLAQMERRSAAQEAHAQVALQLHEKLLRLQIGRIETLLAKFNDHRLMPFLSFDENSSFSKESFERLDQVLMQEAKGLLYTSQEREGTADLAAMINRLEEVPERLEALFHATVNNAIKLCDDTRVLKELLGFLSA